LIAIISELRTRVAGFMACSSPRTVRSPLGSVMGCRARLVGTSLLSLQPVHDKEADQDQGKSEAEQQVQPSDIGICGHRGTLLFLEAGSAFLEFFPAYARY